MSLCGTDGQTNDEQLKIELLSQWKLEAEFRNSGVTLNCQVTLNIMTLVSQLSGMTMCHLNVVVFTLSLYFLVRSYLFTSLNQSGEKV